MRYRIEHYRALDAPDSALGYEYSPTGKVDEIDAHDPFDAAALALSAEDEVPVSETLSFDPGHGLYAFPGDDEAVRVIEIS